MRIYYCFLTREKKITKCKLILWLMSFYSSSSLFLVLCKYIQFFCYFHQRRRSAAIFRVVSILSRYCLFSHQKKDIMHRMSCEGAEPGMVGGHIPKFWQKEFSVKRQIPGIFKGGNTKDVCVYVLVFPPLHLKNF